MNLLIVFAKAPLEGTVKTRLAMDTPLTEKEVCALYEAFLTDVLEIAAKTRAEKVVLNYHPPASTEMMRKLAAPRIDAGRLILVPQAGLTFPERIFNSFAYAYSMGAGGTVMIGSDSPTLQPHIVNRAFDMLDGHGGVVLGPSGEGGIYLIGLGRGHSPDYERIFGEGSELENFAEYAVGAGLPLTILEEVTDVDVASDLVSLVSMLKVMGYASERQDVNLPKNTVAMLESLNLKIIRNGGTRSKMVARGE